MIGQTVSHYRILEPVSYTHLRTNLIVSLALSLTAIHAFANIYGAIRGVVHDPQHRPVPVSYTHLDVYKRQ